MSSPFASAARWVAALVVAIAVLAPSASGCGRASLEDNPYLDAGALDGGSCDATTCPSGCCDASGRCRVGTDLQACGGLGRSCADCVAGGFDRCDGTLRACSRSVADCNESTCRDGCCGEQDGRAQCFAGTDAAACGSAGRACVACASQGRACEPGARTCTSSACNPATCSGCCLGERCFLGTRDTLCGSRAVACADCSATGTRCSLDGEVSRCLGAPRCGPDNCAGCCLGDRCVPGGDATACGSGGRACESCSADGRVCGGAAGARTCQPAPRCTPETCPGCCAGDSCVVAPTAAACGRNGAACRPCGASEQCVSGVCTPQPACGPQTCAGCCVGGICAVGNQATACGVGGAQCANCAANGEACQAGACAPPTCGPANCAGCCAGNVCVVGTQDGACGRAGAACADCAGQGRVCAGDGTCREPCSPANCAGCCRGATCVGGFASAACGSGGAACADCAAQGATCNTLALPRVCSNQPNTCPAPYAGCPNGTSTPVPLPSQNHCADVELEDVRAACLTGPDTGTCLAAMAVLRANNAACGACVDGFRHSFTERTGLYLCVAPDVSAACNASTGCATQCTAASCSQCPAATREQCEAEVGGAGGQCRLPVQETTCVLPALRPGALCSPLTYGNVYGDWLRAVGGFFCGDGT